MVNVSPSGEPLFHAWRIPSAIEVTSPTQSSDPDSMEYRESSLDEQEMDIGMMEPKKRERTRTEEVRFHSTQDAVRQYRGEYYSPFTLPIQLKLSLDDLSIIKLSRFIL